MLAFLHHFKEVYDPPMKNKTMRKLLLSLTGFVTLGWTLFTLYSVGRFGSAAISNPEGTYRIMSVRNGEVVKSAVGLVYHGIPGAALVIVELLLVALALIFAFREKLALRRASLIVLCAWSGLWLANSIWMESLTNWMHATLTLPTAFATLCVLGFAMLRWKKTQP